MTIVKTMAGRNESRDWVGWRGGGGWLGERFIGQILTAWLS